jgi:hypothetical protein
MPGVDRTGPSPALPDALPMATNEPPALLPDSFPHPERKSHSLDEPVRESH